MSYRAEFIADDSGTWATNALTFGTEAEAEDYAIALANRWRLVRRWRVVAVEEEVTHDERA